MINRIFMLIALFAASACAQEAFSVVVQKNNPATRVTKAQLRRMMMGEASSWPGGEKVVVLFGTAGDPARASALKQICGMSESDFSKYALQASFEGGAKSIPKSLPSSAVRQVAQLTAGSLGIVDKGDAGPGLKVLPVE
jgi:ABC-type phosphate transport system substrate-binding protein